MQAAVGDDEHLVLAHLPVDGARQIHAAFADQIPPEFHDEPCFRQDGIARGEGLAECLADGGEIKRLIARKIRQTEAAPEIDEGRRHVRVLC